MANRRVVLCWVGCLVGVTLGVLLIGAHLPGALADLRVYRTGGIAWWQGIPLYSGEFPSWLPFTYPPVSAVVFSGLGIAPWPVAITMLTVAGLLALSATTVLMTPAPAARWAIPCAAAVVVGGLLFEPVRDTLMLGQINLVLMGLVAIDCLLPKTRYPRGLLIGIAAAIKLTPAIFVLFFLARRQVAPVVTAAVTFAGATGLGILLAPSDSASYWTAAVFDADRVGDAAYVTNQSLRGVLHRLDLAPVVEQTYWLLLVSGVLLLAWDGARRAHQAGDRVVALLVVAAAGLLVSPVSWEHHWVWVAPAIVVGSIRAYQRAGRLPAALVLVTAVFAVGHPFLPHGGDRELAWTWWQHLFGSSYLLAAVCFLGWSVLDRAVTTTRAAALRPG